MPDRDHNDELISHKLSRNPEIIVQDPIFPPIGGVELAPAHDGLVLDNTGRRRPDGEFPGDFTPGRSSPRGSSMLGSPVRCERVIVQFAGRVRWTGLAFAAWSAAARACLWS